MLNLLDSVRSHCTGIEPSLVDMHFRRLTAAYFERYSTADIARHLHLLSSLTEQRSVEIEVRPLAAHAFEILVVGFDHPGTVACITAALAAYGFNLEDVQVATYLGTEPGHALAEPNYFIILLRVSGNLQGRALPELAEDLRKRLCAAFAYLAKGNLMEAQSVAADTHVNEYFGSEPTLSRPESKPAPAEFEGMVLGGDFRLQRKLNAGGMSEVYLGTQVSLNRTVAVKLFRQEDSGDEDLLARFYQEGVVLAQFNCPYIVQILAAGTVPGRGSVLGWMAMEYMAGGDLARWQEQHGCPSVELATRWFREALEGLHYAHRHSILHRDLKPHNLLLTAEGHLKVSDFGLLKQIQQPAAGLTPHSAIMGTPHYMSPEQALGKSLDERCDIFSLGTTFFHLISGRLPFNRTSTAAVLVQIAQEDAPSLIAIAPQTPRALDVIVGRMMARDRESRYQDVNVVLEDLNSYERRGLLKMPESGTSYFPMAAEPSWGNAETKAYQSPGGEGDEIAI